MPDDAPQTGQRVWRCQSSLTNSISFLVADHGGGSDFGDVPGWWNPTTPEALAEMRETATLAAAQMMAANRLPGDVADAVMQALGLTQPEPKEGGA